MNANAHNKYEHNSCITTKARHEMAVNDCWKHVSFTRTNTKYHQVPVSNVVICQQK